MTFRRPFPRISQLVSAWLGLVLALGLVAPAALPADEVSLQATTPRKAMREYLVACRRGDYAFASEYLSLRAIPSVDRAARGRQLARQLKVVLDRTLWVDLEALSDAAEGDRDDGLPADQDRVGSIASRSGAVDLLVERTPGREDAWSWKISGVTLARVPDLYEEFGYGALGEWLPGPFFELTFLEVQLWQWVGIAALVLCAFALAWAATSLAVRLARRVVALTASSFDDRLLRLAASPMRLALAVAIFAAGLPLLALAVPAEGFLSGLAKAAAVVAVAWLAFRLVDVLVLQLSDHLVARGQTGLTAILPPGGRVAKAILGALAVLVMLQNFGVNVTALLAGLGVGGIAVALAAQRTVENLFGGITLIADQPVRVGDFCRFGNSIGTVEDIGLRSTRVRTLDRTVVAIPNADFSRLELENFSKRERVWYHPRIGLRYETTPEQIRYILVEIRRMLYAHPKVHPDPARIRFVGFGAYSLDLDVFAYVDTADYGEFLEVAEDLNLRIMDIIAASGSGFAFPSQTTYLEKGEGLDAERGASAEAEVARWRREGRLFLPGFPPDEIARLGATLDYPPQGSPLRREA